MRSLLSRIAEWPIRYRRGIALVSCALFLLSIVGISRVVVSADFIKIFDESTRIRQDYQHVESTLGGTSSIEIVISRRENAW